MHSNASNRRGLSVAQDSSKPGVRNGEDEESNNV